MSSTSSMCKLDQNIVMQFYTGKSVKDIGQNMHVDVCLLHGHRKVDSTYTYIYNYKCIYTCTSKPVLYDLPVKQ